MGAELLVTGRARRGKRRDATSLRSPPSVPIRRCVARSGTRAPRRFGNLVGLVPKSASHKSSRETTPRLTPRRPHPNPNLTPPQHQPAMSPVGRNDVMTRQRGFTNVPSVVRSLPGLSAGVRNYIYHVRFLSPRPIFPRRRDVPPARERVVTPTPPLSSSPSRPSPTPRASQPPRTRAPPPPPSSPF